MRTKEGDTTVSAGYQDSASGDDIVQRNAYVKMERDNLLNIPQHPLPADFQEHWYEPGDARIWLEIQQQAETHVAVTLSDFQRVFGDDESELAARQCFLFDARQCPMATATAWYEADFHGQPYGRVHWVAVIPEYQGRGLSKPLLTVVLNRMAQLGHERVFLRTSTARLTAITLYQRFGFRPSLRSEQERLLWRQLNSLLGRPFEL